MTQDLITEVAGSVASVTLNRPDVRNALSAEMVQGMKDFFLAVERDDSIRCLVIRGAGEHFMAGGDVKGFGRFRGMPASERRDSFERRIHELHPAIFTLRRMNKPVLASVQGAAAGFGLSLMMACDLVIAADSAFFTLAYINIGTSPDGSGTYFLPRIVGQKKAMEIALLGDRFDAEAAKAAGLINFIVPAADLAAETAKLAARLAQGPTRAIANTKRLINMSLEQSLESQLQAEAMSFADCAASEDWIEGVTAFAEKRKPKFRGR